MFDSIIFWVTIRQAIYFRSVPTIENSVFTLMAYDGGFCVLPFVRRCSWAWRCRCDLLRVRSPDFDETYSLTAPPE